MKNALSINCLFIRVHSLGHTKSRKLKISRTSCIKILNSHAISRKTYRIYSDRFRTVRRENSLLHQLYDLPVKCPFTGTYVQIVTSYIILISLMCHTSCVNPYIRVQQTIEILHRYACEFQDFVSVLRRYSYPYWP